MKLVFVLILCIVFASAWAKVCVTKDVFEDKEVKNCKPTQVAPYTKKIIVKVPYQVKESTITQKTENKKKTVCYNQAYTQTYKVPIKKHRYEQRTETVKVDEKYTVQVPYETTIKAERDEPYKHWYDKKITINYLKKVTKTKTIQVPYTYEVDCKIPETKYYYVDVPTPYNTKCDEPATRIETKTIKVPKEVETWKEVWTGDWEGPIDCSKKVMKKVKGTKTIMVDKKVEHKVNYMKQVDCVKYKPVKTKKEKIVYKNGKCPKQGTKPKVITYTVEEPATKEGTERAFVWKTKKVSYDKKVYKYKTETRTRDSYTSKVVKKWVPYYTYETKTRTAYRLAHKTVDYTVTVDVVSEKLVTKYKLVEKTVPTVTMKDVCTTEVKKVKTGVKTTCTGTGNIRP